MNRRSHSIARPLAFGSALDHRFGSLLDPFWITWPHPTGHFLQKMRAPIHRAVPLDSPRPHPSSPEKTGHPLPRQTRCSGFPVDSEGEPAHDDHPWASNSLQCERVPCSGQRPRWKDRSARMTARWIPVRTQGMDQKVYLPSQLERSQSQTTQRGLQMDQNC